MTKKEKLQMIFGLSFVFYFIIMLILTFIGLISFGFTAMISIPVFLFFGIGAQIIYGMKS